MKDKNFSPAVLTICHELISEFNLISNERKEQLQQLSYYIASKYKEQEVPQIIVICTHNSRRSQLAQIWLAVAADYYSIGIEAYSGGTEVTAFHPNAVRAFKTLGFNIESSDSVKNPIYSFKWKTDMVPYMAFSKKYDENSNPSENFAAVMVCNDADTNCPVIHGAAARIALPFKDPKAFDSTPNVEEGYNERCREIGREMFYALSLMDE